jgi:hypothetical protein
MNREQLRERIDALECLGEILSAIDDMPGTEDPLGITLTERGGEKLPISFVHNVPPEIVLIGLRAMQQAMEKITAQEALPA